METKIFSPILKIEKNIKKICLNLYFWVGNEEDKFEIITFENEQIRQRDYCLSNQLQIKQWNKKTIKYSYLFNRVSIFFLFFFNFY